MLCRRSLTADIAETPKGWNFIIGKELGWRKASLTAFFFSGHGSLSSFRFDSWEKPTLLVFFVNIMFFETGSPWVLKTIISHYLPNCNLTCFLKICRLLINSVRLFFQSVYRNTDIYVVRSAYFKNMKCIIDWNGIFESMQCTTVSLDTVGMSEHTCVCVVILPSWTTSKQ